MDTKIAKIEKVAGLLYPRLSSCDLCPRNCRVDRLKGKIGYCGAGQQAVAYTAFLHQGEEPGISAGAGSGTIFFAGCSLKCIYCQNYQFSHTVAAPGVSDDQLAQMMLKLQGDGAVNINLVTPSHFLPQILKSLHIAVNQGLTLPIVYNTSGYEKEGIIKLLDGIVDVYLTDMKYITSEAAKKYSNAPDYPQRIKAAIPLMYDQVKVRWDNGILKQGVVIRHLVLPGYLPETEKILHWMADNVPDALASVMFQYRPYYKANTAPEIDRALKVEECLRVKDLTEELGLNGWVQGVNTDEGLAGVYFTP